MAGSASLRATAGPAVARRAAEAMLQANDRDPQEPGDRHPIRRPAFGPERCGNARDAEGEIRGPIVDRQRA